MQIRIGLLSAVTIMLKEDIETWDSLKKLYRLENQRIEYKRKRKNVYLEIKKVRKKLDRNIAENGLADKRTREYSDEIDILINEYYRNKRIIDYPSNSLIINYYNISYKELKKVTEEFKEFPCVNAWNNYAKQKKLLNNVSMQYIANLDWNKLRTRIKAEINSKI